jgi:hypothetical protein
MRETRTSGSVRDEGGNLLAYATSARPAGACQSHPQRWHDREHRDKTRHKW